MSCANIVVAACEAEWGLGLSLVRQNPISFHSSCMTRRLPGSISSDRSRRRCPFSLYKRVCHGVWRVLSASARRTRFDPTLEGGRTRSRRTEHQ